MVTRKKNYWNMGSENGNREHDNKEKQVEPKLTSAIVVGLWMFSREICCVERTAWGKMPPLAEEIVLRRSSSLASKLLI
jgi:hypothetical protein